MDPQMIPASTLQKCFSPFQPVNMSEWLQHGGCEVGPVSISGTRTTIHETARKAQVATTQFQEPAKVGVVMVPLVLCLSPPPEI